VTSLPDYVEFRKFPGIPLKDIFSAAGDDLLDMLDRLLDCNPSGRVNATQVQLNSLRIRASLIDVTTAVTQVVSRGSVMVWLAALA